MGVKSIFKKLIICLLIFLILFNFMIASVTKVNIVFAKTNEELAAEAEAETKDAMGAFFNGLAGILTYLPKLLMNLLARLMQSMAFFVIDSAGHGTETVSKFLSPFDIFFNKFTLININIFQYDDIEDTSGGDMVRDMREATSMLYYVFLSIAVGLLFVVLIVTLIKMSIASLAEEKARLKNMFLDWVVSAGLMLFLHYIILFVIRINEGLIEIIENAADGNSEISNTIDSLRTAAFSVSFLLGWGATIAYFMITIQTMFFVIIYLYRFFKVLCLIIVSPLVPLTFSIDRSKGGVAKALNGWMAEFLGNVFIQPIHCIIYVIIIYVPMSAIEDITIGSISNLTVPLFLIIALSFVRKAETLLVSLFGLDKATTVSTLNSTVNSVRNTVLTATSIANGTYTVTNNVSNNKTTFGSNIQTLGERASNKVHEYRDRAASWLDKKEMEEAHAKMPTETNFSEEYDEDAVDAEYREINEKGFDEQNGPVPILLSENILTDEEANKVADAVASTRREEEKNENIDEENTENKQININEENLENEQIDINEENLEEHFKEEEYFGTFKRDENYLKEDEKQDFIKDLENVLRKYQEGKADIDDIIRRFEEHNLKYDNNTIQSLLDKFGRENKVRVETKEISAKNIEDFINKNKVISNWRNERNYREPEVKAEFIQDLKRALEKYKKGEIGIDEVEKRFSDYGLAVDSNVINKLLKEFTPERTENKLEEINLSNDESQNKDIEVVQGDVVDITDDIKISSKALKILINNTREVTRNNSKILEAVEGDITVEGDFTEAKIINFNTKILEKAKSGAYSESNFKKAEEAVKKEGDIAVRRLEKFKAEQSKANAKMLTPAGKKYAELMVEAQQAGVFVVSASMAENSVYQESFNQNVYSSRQAMDIRRNPEVSMNRNNPELLMNQKNPAVPTSRSNNVLNDLNQRKKHA